MANHKMYHFSLVKHAHDIEFYHNRLFNTMCDMESGEIPMDKARYDKIYDMYYGELRDLQNAMMNSPDGGRTCLLTGKQIYLAKRIVVWATETRVAKCIEQGRYNDIRYC